VGPRDGVYGARPVVTLTCDTCAWAEAVKNSPRDVNAAARRHQREQSRLGPCAVCGSTRSRRSRHPSGNVYCAANADGRDRCREREVAKAFGKWVGGEWRPAS
jgi:hypothetical protein